MVTVEASGLTAVSRIYKEETSDLILSEVNCYPLSSAIPKCRFLAAYRSESFHLWISLLLTVCFQLYYTTRPVNPRTIVLGLREVVVVLFER